MAFTCKDPAQNSGNDEHAIPVKQGAPLSAACDRAATTGSIPEVIRYANWTKVAGAPVGSKISNGGIQNMSAFFKTREGCYYDKDARFSGSTCA